QEKETATKIASDAAATLQQPTGGETENRAAGAQGQAQAQSMATADGRADLDAYIQSLLSTPTPGGTAEEQGSAIPHSAGNPDGGSSPPENSAEKGMSRRIAERLSSLKMTCGLGCVDSVPKAVELYDKGCQADFAGAAGTVGLGVAGPDEDLDAMEAPQSSSLLKKTPDKRRNHRRVFGRGGKGVLVPDGSEGEDLGYPPSGGPSLIAASSPSKLGIRPMASTPRSRSGRWTSDGSGGLAALPMTPPTSAAKPLSVDDKKEILQTDHFQASKQQSTANSDQ
ncbi:unnamed protein product, partial [Hapterophycus canaliculatus]